VCIGEQFAWMEATLILATIAQRWRLRHEPGHAVALEPLVTLRPKYGMRMILVRREDARGRCVTRRAMETEPVLSIERGGVQ
jgi:hypothetical protein